MVIKWNRYRILLISLLGVISLRVHAQTRNYVDLSGNWRFSLDRENEGIKSKWFNQNLRDVIHLPGTTDEAKKGIKNDHAELKMLTRLYPYAGAAWYQHDIVLPESWKGKHVTFTMERTKTATVWLDSTLIGSQNSLTTAQVYDLSGISAPGKHRVTIRVSNSEKPPIGEPHQISDQTQTNWNGIIGRINLTATDRIWLNNIQCYPEMANHTVKFKISVGSLSHWRLEQVKLSISAKSWNSAKPQIILPQLFELQLDNKNEATCTFKLPGNVQLWNEFSPALYKFNLSLTAKVHRRHFADEQQLDIGLKTFTTDGKHFTNNGKIVFLRGKHDACVFPLTGYPPMTVDGWLKVFRIAKSYGLNHYRFHTWCPPDAAFAAADIAGIYLQPELPVWGPIGRGEQVRREDVEQHIDNDPVQHRTDYLLAEGKRLLDFFGNHASFVMLSLGNEMSGSRSVMADMVRQFRVYDPRHLYAQGSNNFLNEPRYAQGDDYWTTALTGGHYSPGDYKADTKGKDVRASYAVHSFGHLNNLFAGTTYDYHTALEGIPLPVISHEVGQYEVFPNFNEISKYRGVLEAKNFEVFRDRLQKAGMGEQANDFFKASGALAVICYREEIEAALRTPQLAGFHLLDLQDFPGQGTALVGILDAFMDSKGLISPEKWRRFCSSTVPLIKMPSYIWTNQQTYTAQAEVANYGPEALNKPANWYLLDKSGHLYASGTFSRKIIKQGGITVIGKIAVDLREIAVAQKMTLTLTVGNFVNDYNIWVYPLKARPEPLVVVAKTWNDTVKRQLEEGKAVLLIADSAHLKRTIPGAFSTDFWCYPMFKKYNPPGTMGLLCDPLHPIFTDFPTSFHSDWQWWRIAKNSPVMVLNDLPKSIRPLIQVIDNFERNDRLGLLFEAKYGKGKLIVSSIDLTKDLPEINALNTGIQSYMNSKAFNPKNEINDETLSRLFIEKK